MRYSDAQVKHRSSPHPLSLSLSPRACSPLCVLLLVFSCIRMHTGQGKIRQPGSKDLAQATRCTDANFLSFLRKCLKWDPKARITPDKALVRPHHCPSLALACVCICTQVYAGLHVCVPPDAYPSACLRVFA